MQSYQKTCLIQSAFLIFAVPQAQSDELSPTKQVFPVVLIINGEMNDCFANVATARTFQSTFRFAEPQTDFARVAQKFVSITKSYELLIAGFLNSRTQQGH